MWSGIEVMRVAAGVIKLQNTKTSLDKITKMYDLLPVKMIP